MKKKIKKKNFLEKKLKKKKKRKKEEEKKKKKKKKECRNPERFMLLCWEDATSCRKIGEAVLILTAKFILTSRRCSRHPSSWSASNQSGKTSPILYPSLLKKPQPLWNSLSGITIVSNGTNSWVKLPFPSKIYLTVFLGTNGSLCRREKENRTRSREIFMFKSSSLNREIMSLLNDKNSRIRFRRSCERRNTMHSDPESTKEGLISKFTTKKATDLSMLRVY